MSSSCLKLAGNLSALRNFFSLSAKRGSCVAEVPRKNEDIRIKIIRVILCSRGAELSLGGFETQEQRVVATSGPKLKNVLPGPVQTLLHLDSSAARPSAPLWWRARHFACIERSWSSSLVLIQPIFHFKNLSLKSWLFYIHFSEAWDALRVFAMSALVVAGAMVVARFVWAALSTSFANIQPEHKRW